MGQVFSSFNYSNIEITSELPLNPTTDINIEDIYPSDETFDASTSDFFEGQADGESITVDSVSFALQLRDINLTPEQVKEIEADLEFYEKVSLVFLLYENNLLALQELELLMMGNQKEPLFNWAMYEAQNGPEWIKKLIEALCIIQNYEVLNKLGYEKSDLSSYFLPSSEYSINCIQRDRKFLYLVCERLTSNQTRQFLHLVKEDLARKYLDIKEYGDIYLEMYFLHWITINYISIGDVRNFNNIACIFKEVGCDNIYDLLKLSNIDVHEINKPESSKMRNFGRFTVSEESEIHLPETENSYSGKKSYENPNRTDTYQQAPVDQSLCTNSSLPETTSGNKSPLAEKKYEMNPDKPGICIIINQINFYTEPNFKYRHLLANTLEQLERRDGTEVDGYCLKTTFEAFGYKVVEWKNLTHFEMIPAIEEALNIVREESSVFLCILSHGDEGVVYGVNSCKVSFDDIKEALCKTNRQHLVNKPKVLILQSCRGIQCQKILENLDATDYEYITKDGPNASTPTTVDLFTFCATVRGYAAVRNKKSGSWFIKSLCHYMKTIGNKKHFEDICTAVIDDISEKKLKKDNECYGMVPEKQSTLRRSFYLPPLVPNRSENSEL